jgi:hypothetical protein
MDDGVTTVYVYANGQPVPAGFCVMPDNWTTSFVVRVRSMQPVSADALKALIQGKLEVVEIARTAEKCVVRNSPHAN